MATGRIKSFTIIELMMSLMISSIVIGISYYAFIFFNRQFNLYRQKSVTINSYLLFKKTFQNDFDHSSMIIDSAGSFILLSGINRGQDITKYFFGRNVIVRSYQSTTDTFDLDNTINSLEYVSDRLHFVKALHLEISLDSTHIEPSFMKNYTSQELISGENN